MGVETVSTRGAFRVALVALVTAMGSVGILASISGRPELAVALLTVSGPVGLCATIGRSLDDEAERRAKGRLDGLRGRLAGEPMFGSGRKR